MKAHDCFIVRPGSALQGTARVPGDKSISHRAVFFGALASGTTTVRRWLPAGDTLASLGAARALGVIIEEPQPGELVIHGGELHPPQAPLNLVNAGTGIRLLSGILCGQRFGSILDGSEQLRRRPMKRIIEPLRLMGAHIEGSNDRAPLTIEPAALKGIRYDMPVASAQVKSAILLAGLFADGPTVVTQPGPARDHTELMLRAMGADLDVSPHTAELRPGKPLRAMDFTVPGDLSSAAFPIAAALLVPGSDITLEGVSLNPTRTGILDAVQAMGADVSVTETGLEAGDPVGTIRVRYSALKGIEIGGEIVVRMIDEFPIFMVLALAAEGRTVVRDAQELRVKETDRISVMAGELSKLGARITETDDGFIIDGPQRLHAATTFGHDDHRISMSMTVASLIAEGESTVLDARCTADSFPGFAHLMRELGAEVEERELTS